MTVLLSDWRARWAVFALIAIATLIVYSLTGFASGQGNLLMPLDDVYIHFQYARQMALGQPYQYNLIDPPTSGATSFLYPYVLAFGYLIGFRGLWLGLWALLVGTIAFFAAMIAVYRLCRVFPVPAWLALALTLAFALTGSFAWHFMSGMETGLMIAFTLWTLLLLIEKRPLPFVVVASLLSLLRPEGGVLAASAALMMVLRVWYDDVLEKRGIARWRILLLIVPVLAIALQPAMNAFITGTTVATGNQAKSILASVPNDSAQIISRILDNAALMGVEFLTGTAPSGVFVPFGVGLIALLTVPLLLLRRNWRVIGLLLMGWLVAMIAAISTLDNAFWHFKRYQMPIVALFFPLAAWGLTLFLNRFRALRHGVYLYAAGIVPLLAIFLALQFNAYYALNVRYVYEQPYQMALWLNENTPQDAVIAVHDVGLMRYAGERSTLDMVGLTTPDAAAFWRNGPGSVAEFLMMHQPDYIASYGRGHGYGLAFLADTALYGDALAAFVIDDWQRATNVALAADAQAIYQTDWATIMAADACQPQDAHLLRVDVANLTSEADAGYTWDSRITAGFATEARQFGSAVEGYRRIDGFDQFDLTVTADAPLLLTTVVHAANAGQITIYQDDALVATRWIPEIPGELVMLHAILEARPSTIRIAAPFAYYQPVCHTIQPYDVPDTSPPDTPLAQYQDGAFTLAGGQITRENPDQLQLDLTWFTAGQAQGDYRFFVHVYDDRTQPPLVQWDGYAAGAPPGNWLAGYLSDKIALNLDGLAAGEYVLAIGFYNPLNPQDRLQPDSTAYDVASDGRLWLDTIEVTD